MSCNHTKHQVSQSNGYTYGVTIRYEDGTPKEFWVLCKGRTAEEPFIDKNLLRGEYDILQGRINEALEYLTQAADRVFRRSGEGQLIESLGCILSGRKSSWWPHNNQPR